MKLEELRATYVAKLPARIEELHQALAKYRGGDAAGLDSLRRIAHSLRGSGASYGFPAISTAAAALEDSPEGDVPSRVDELIVVLTSPQSDPDSFTVLLVIADTIFRDRLQASLSGPGRDILCAGTGVKGHRIIEQGPPALIILDLLLPDMDGRNLLKKLRMTPGLEDVPVIIVAARGNADLREECFSLGADHYFDKACDLSLLSVTVDSALKNLLRAASTTHVRVMSRLLGKRALEELYERMARAGGDRRRCLVLLDFGELAGPAERDEVLHRISGTIFKHIRSGDQLARWGESQLVMLLNDTRRPGAVALIRRLGQVIEDMEFRTQTKSYRVAFQAGIAALDRSLPPLSVALKRAQGNLEIEQERVGVSAGSREATSSQTILLAEDDPEFASLVKYVLDEAGFTVEHHLSGDGVFESAIKEQFALILLDVKMPGLDGFELLERLRASSVVRRVPVALLTALGHERDVVRGLELGADDYIVKPCSPKELVARVRRLLRLHKPPGHELGLGGMAGRFSDDQLVELLQMLGSNCKSGRLTVWGSSTQGHIDLHKGTIVGADTTSGRAGVEAAHELLLAHSGRFEFDPAAVLPAEARTLSQPVGPVLMDSMRRRDEASQL